MNDAAEIPPSSLAPADKKARGRPTKPAPETPQQRIERLQAELLQAQQAAKVAEQHQAAIVGAVVVRHMRADNSLRRQIAALLRADVKSKTDLAAIAELLVEP